MGRSGEGLETVMNSGASWLWEVLGERDQGGEPYPLPGRFWPLGEKLPVLHRDDAAPAYLWRKRAICRSTPGRCDLRWPQAPPEVLTSAHARLLGLQGGSMPGGTTPGALGEFMTEQQEDLVVMVKGEGESAAQARIGYVHVAFPSGWRPERSLGLDFAAIHHAVPGHDRFPADQQLRLRLAASMFGGRIRVRYVWTVSGDPGLDRHPDYGERATPWALAPTVYLRVERQIVVPVDATHSLFVIRLYVFPLQALPQSIRKRVFHLVGAMPATIAEYKGLASDRVLILEKLKRLL